MKQEIKKTPNYTVAKVSGIVGLSMSVLRMWETRYHWPKPRRTASGYRKYSDQDIASIQVVAHFIKLGRSISAILDDHRISPLHNPNITMDSLYPRRGPAPEITFTEVEAPQTQQGKRLREQLENAININDLGRIAQLEAESLRLAPQERQKAAIEIIAIARKKQAMINCSAGS